MLALPPPFEAGPQFEEFRERVGYEAAALRVSVSNAISDGGDIRVALSAWKDRLAADFRTIVDMQPMFDELPVHLRQYDRPDFFEALQGLWNTSANGIAAAGNDQGRLPSGLATDMVAQSRSSI